MAILKKTSFPENLEKYSVLVNDTATDSRYFKLTDLENVFTGGKNAFLIQGSPELVAGTAVKIEIKDSKGNVIYTEPGEGIPEYYEGVSKPVAVYVYPDTAFGECTLTILGELQYYQQNGINVNVPDEWKNKYNVRWQKKIMVNPFVSNTTKIRFYRRPKVSIEEVVLPIAGATILRSTISGSISGVATIPAVNSNFLTFTGNTLYELNTTASVFSSSMEGETITVSGLAQSYSTVVKDVVNSKQLLATRPYYVSQSNGNQTVTNFTEAPFELTYTSNTNYVDTSLFASYAKIKLTDLETFSGDPSRLKISAKRRAGISTTYTLLEDIQLESNEKLQVDSYSGSINIRTGDFLNQELINDFWVYRDYDTPATTYTALYDNELAASAVILEDDGVANSTIYPQRVFYYSASIDLIKETEYQLDFSPILSSSIASPSKIEVYGSGSAFINTNSAITLGKKLMELTPGETFRRYDKQQVNFNPDSTGTGTIVFAVHQGNWNISNVSLRASSETSFSPNEITINVSMPTIVSDDTYDFKFEFYDINNTYVPVNVVASHTFTGGTDLTGLGSTGTGESFFVQPDSTIFSFGWDNTYDFSEIYTANPIPIGAKTIGFLVQQNGYTGSTGILFTSQAYDASGNYITPASYTGFDYPGFLTKIDDTSYYLTVENFTGSKSETISVKRIAYTASLQGISPPVEDVMNIYKVVEGTPGSDGQNNDQYIIQPLSGSAIKNSNPSQLLELQLTRIQSGSTEYVSSGNVKLVTGSLNTVIAAGNGITAGANGVEYNPIISAQKISGSLIVGAYDFVRNLLVDTITLADITDGLATGYVEASRGLILKRNPNNSNLYNPATTALTASFFDNFGTQYTASILITANYSSGDQLKYQTGITDPNVSLDFVRNVEGATLSDNVYSNTQGVVAKWTFTEPTTNQQIVISEGASVAVDGAVLTVTLSNENATLTAASDGFVPSASFAATTGSITVNYGNANISYASPLVNNTYSASVSASSNVTGANINASGEYSITRLDSDLGNMTLEMTYRDSDSIDSTVKKTVTYNKALSGIDGATGPQGSVGPGVVYVGNCDDLDSTWVWESNDITRHITSIGSPPAYYACTPLANGANKTTTGCPPNATYFTLLTSFASVATDILLAKDATILRALVLGQYSGAGDPSAGIIRSANAIDIDRGEGFYITAENNGAFRVGDPSVQYMQYSDGELTLRGNVDIDSGRIGNWYVDADGQYAGTLRNSTNNIVFDASDSEIVLSSDGILRSVVIKSGILSTLGSSTIAYNFVPQQNTNTISSATITSTTSTGWSLYTYFWPTYGTNGVNGNSVVIPTAGTYNITGVTMPSTLQASPMVTLSSGDNDNASGTPLGDQATLASWYLNGSVYWSAKYSPRETESHIYLQAYDVNSGIEVASRHMGTAASREAYQITNRYVLFKSGGVYSWIPMANIYDAGYVTATPAAGAAVTNFSMTLPAGNIGFRYLIAVRVKSGYFQQIYGGTVGPIYSLPDFRIATNKGLSSIGSSTNINIVLPENVTEIASNGIIVASSTAASVKINKVESPGSFPELVNVTGGIVRLNRFPGESDNAFDQDINGQTLMVCHGKIITGTVFAYGDINGNNGASDIRFKENVKVIDNALEKVNNIDGVYFYWNADADKLMSKPTGSLQIGLIAQQVQKTLPEIVDLATFDRNEEGKSESGNNYLMIQYERVVPLLIEAIKELKKEVDILKLK